MKAKGNIKRQKKRPTLKNEAVKKPFAFSTKE
jgi:hypothetical protein